jgi:hypothetical protein
MEEIGSAQTVSRTSTLRRYTTSVHFQKGNSGDKWRSVLCLRTRRRRTTHSVRLRQVYNSSGRSGPALENFQDDIVLPMFWSLAGVPD